MCVFLNTTICIFQISTKLNIYTLGLIHISNPDNFQMEQTGENISRTIGSFRKE